MGPRQNGPVRRRQYDVVTGRTVKVHLMTERVEVGLERGRVWQYPSRDAQNLGFLSQVFSGFLDVDTAFSNEIDAPE